MLSLSFSVAEEGRGSGSGSDSNDDDDGRRREWKKGPKLGAPFYDDVIRATARARVAGHVTA